MTGAARALRPAAALLPALLACWLAWWFGGALLERLSLGILDLPFRLGLVFFALGGVERVLARLLPAHDPEGDDHG